jgi:hypothetical protein
MDWLIFFVLLMAAFAIIVCLGAALAYAGHLATDFWPKPKPAPSIAKLSDWTENFPSREELLGPDGYDLTDYTETAISRIFGVPPDLVQGANTYAYAEEAEQRTKFWNPVYIERDGTVTHWPQWQEIS